ncbi:MAG: tRNA pseudouridine(38-40) synthase TruA [Clostridia bacterium]|nr:tRNA pseudouridine(38-40) synthase TruA [Clostridia bacterium]
MKILLKLMFNGSAYCGFQSQSNGRAIQNVLTDTFSHMFGFPCTVTGCSRTDSGVHAKAFCATLAPFAAPAKDEWCTIPVGKIHRAANRFLPEDISVVGATYVPDDFHPRYNVVSKEYEYHIYDAPSRNPFLNGRAYQAPRRISADAETRMNKVASAFVGKHNFSAFMASGSKITDPVRTVFAASVSRDPDGILVYRVEADGFLYNMVRIMAGTLLETAYGICSEKSVHEAISTGDRSKAGFTAPPHALYLSKVHYDREICWLAE